MIIVPFRNIELDNSLPSIQDPVKRKRSQMESDTTAAGSSLKPPVPPVRKVQRDIAIPSINSISGNAGVPIHMQSKGGNSFQETSNSPLNKLPAPWKQFLNSFLHKHDTSH